MRSAFGEEHRDALGPFNENNQARVAHESEEVVRESRVMLCEAIRINVREARKIFCIPTCARNRVVAL